MPCSRLARLALAGLFAGLVGGCGSDDASAPNRITVLAASSLTSPFTEIGEAFTAAHPESPVVFDFAASSELATRIEQGAPADVFAAADQTTMTRLAEAGGTSGTPVVFATNSLAIIVEPGNPQGIGSLADLADPDLVVLVCATEVPCGRYAAEALTGAGVALTPKSYEQSASFVVSKVVEGEADAGVVYVTDVIAAGGSAEGVDIAPAQNVLAEYPIAVTAESGDPASAQAFIDFVLGDAGQSILAAHGFGGP